MKKNYLKNTLLLVLFFLIGTNLSAQWKNANPGHGGQVQHVICDPTIDGRMYLCSDMEGYYYSDDYGQKWHYVHSSPFNNVFNIAIAPTNSNTMLLGATNGFAVSKDQGASWDVQEMFIDVPISAMAIDPSDENNMYVAPSWLEDTVPHFSENGEKAVYYSNDAGVTWTKKVFSGNSGERNVNTITVHPTNGEVLLAATEGLFLSKDEGLNWSQLNSPANTTLCRGADITPNGEWVYALYVRNDGNSGLYVRKYTETTWVEIDASGLLQEKNQTHWRPLISKTSTDTEHFMLMGTFKRGGNGTENALLEGRFTVNADVVSGEVVEVFRNPGMDIQDIGWNDYQGVSRTYDYYPASWTNHTFTRGAFIMSQQSTYVGDVTATSTWNCVTSTYVKTLNGRRFYRTNGTASTYNWDMVGYKNYVAQLMGDNGIVESYDGGDTWNQPTIVFQGNWNADAGELVMKEGQDPLILVGTANGFGGAQSEWSGKLLMKTMTNLDGPADQYKVLIDGYSDDLRGLGDQNRISSIHADVLNPGRVYISTIGGAYVTDNIFELINDNEEHYFRKISNGEAQSQGRKIISDPNDGNVVYLRCGNGSFRGERQSSGEYTWTKLLINGSSNGLEGQWGSNGDMNVWAQGNTSYLLVTKGNSSNVDYELHISIDQGATFTKVVDRSMAEAFGVPDWVNIYNCKTGFGGLVGKEKEFYFTFHVRERGEEMSSGIRFFKATIGDDLSDITLEDLTGTPGQNDLEYPLARRGKIWKDQDNKEHLYIATMGTGLWVLPLATENQPVSVITVEENHVQVPVEVEFDGSGSYAVDGKTIAAYEWTFGGEVVATTEKVKLSFDTEGVHTIYLKVTDSDGVAHSTSYRLVTINDNVKTIINSSQSMGYAPLYIELDGSNSSSKHGEIVSYKWYHDNQEISSEEILRVNFPTAGNYIYELEAEDSEGNSSKETLTINVFDYNDSETVEQELIVEGLEGYVYTEGGPAWQVWAGKPSVGTLAEDHTANVHYGTQWGVHASSGYPNASGDYSAFINTADKNVFSIEDFDVSGVDNLRLSFGMMKCSNIDGDAVPNEDNSESMKFEYSTDGVNWIEISLADKFDYVNETNPIWYWVELDEDIPSVENLRLRWTKQMDNDPYNTLWRVDDITFTTVRSVALKAPTVEIASSPSEIYTDEPATFTAVLLGTVDELEWDFNNGSTAEGQGPHEVVYTEEGDYEVTVMVKNQKFDADASSTINVAIGDKVEAVINSSQSMGYAPLYIELDGSNSSSNKGDIVSYKWYHEDQEISTEEMIKANFPTAGNYLYVLEAEDSEGNSSTDSLTINVYDYVESESIKEDVIIDDLEGFEYVEGGAAWQVWVGKPNVGTLAADNNANIHYGPQWGVHASSGYPNASGLYSAFMGNDGTKNTFSVENFDISGIENLQLSFGMMKCSIIDGDAVQNEDDGESMKFEYSTDGVNWTEISLSGKFDYVNEANPIWYWVEIDEEIPAVENLRLRWTKQMDNDPHTTLWRVDDITFSTTKSIPLEDPTVKITSSSNEINKNESVTFTAEVLGTVQEVMWDFKNDEEAEGLGPHEVLYTEAGDYEVTLMVKNQKSTLTSTSALKVNNSFGSIEGEVSIDKDEAYNLEDVTYSITHNGDDDLQFEWNFGENIMHSSDENPTDVVVTSEPTITMQYLTGGVKSITVTMITNDDKRFEVSGSDMITIEEREITSADDLSKYGVIVYPNPTQQDVRIKGLSSGTYKIVNQVGQIVLEGEFKEYDALPIDLPNGVYFMIISDGIKVMTHKLIRK
ncbi:PKD domain-containing protein [Flammeovirga pacifica]|uniref:PKD domain-containing protein n=1 Tax=Flammeovirga pacifica TaxID=915059 RepID=A0A1S1YSJ9_FLAPC|nr:PKD domain-containing protein [Flammeovirga pacifica]OHX63843.1 hypothetical protein NH26_19720 [Flammeovirga pacifica]